MPRMCFVRIGRKGKLNVAGQKRQVARPMNRAVLAMLVCAVMAVPAHAQISASASLSVAMAHLGQGDWSGAEAAVANHSQIGRDIVIWHKLRAGQGQFGEYQDFLARRPDWPGLPLLVEAGESVIPADTEPVDVIAYFASTPPQTGTGALRLASAYVAIGASPSAADVIRTAWLTLPLNRTETGLFALRHADWLEDLHAARLDMLLWQGHLPQAVRMLARVDPATKDVAQTRLALLRRDRGVDDLIGELSSDQRDGPGLAQARFKWRLRAGQRDGATELLLAQSARPGGLGRPEHWAKSRLRLARRAFDDGDDELAYQLTTSHGLTHGAEFAALGHRLIRSQPDTQ